MPQAGGQAASAAPAEAANRPAPAPKIAAYKAPVAPAGLNALQLAAFNTKVVYDWAGYDTIEKMRAADTEVIYAAGTLYNNATGNAGSVTARPIVDGYVSLESFDEAALDGTLADIPYMIGFTMNDSRDHTDGIIAFGQNRKEKGGKAWFLNSPSHGFHGSWNEICNAGDLGSILGLGRSPGEGNGNPLQYSCLGNPTDTGAWRATVYGAASVGHNVETKPLPQMETWVGRWLHRKKDR